MGYTHYWTIHKDIPQDKFDEFVSDVRKIVDASVVILKRSRYTRDEVLLEGTHETFVVNRLVKDASTRTLGWSFCKTARKPYDEIVVACLFALEKTRCATWSSDGMSRDHEAGKKLFIRATGYKD